jgi:glycerol-3-phosphate acyltransferase PlsY
MLAVVAGHIWPAQLRFHGGKGMATALGALLAYDLQLAATFAVLFLCLMTALRRVVLPSLIALACLPLASLLLGHTQIKIVLLSVLAGLVVIAHRRNLAEEFSLWAERHNFHPKSNRL